MTALNIYRLVPDAPATDPGWQLSPSMGEIIVRAASPAEARVVAANGEPDFPDFDARPGHGVETAFASAVRDTKLYRVERIESGEFPSEGEPAVLRAGPMDDLIKPQDPS